MIRPIVIIEDDKDDQEIFRCILKVLPIENETMFFSTAKTALTYLSRPEVTPFIIFSDINMPIMNGFQLRDIIHEDPVLRLKCIPFIFLTTGGESLAIREAYSKNAQGFFIKPTSIAEWTELLTIVTNYWKKSKKP